MAASRAPGSESSCPSEACRAVAECAEQAGRCSRGLRSTWPVLARDALALLAGMRRAAMLDYAPRLQAAQAAGFVRHLQRALPAAQGVPLAVAELQGCCYLVRLDMLAHAGTCLAPQRFLAFDSALSPVACAWASTSQLQALATQLMPAAALFRSALSSKPGNVPVVLLDELGGLPILPTFNGWLLGYPIVYLVDEASVSHTAKFLGSEPLHLYHMVASCQGLQDALPQAALSRVPKSLPMDALFSFSVPARVDSQPVRSKGGHPSTEPGEASLCRQLQHSCCRWAVKGFEGVWDLPQLSCISCQHHVVL